MGKVNGTGLSRRVWNRCQAEQGITLEKVSHSWPFSAIVTLLVINKYFSFFFYTHDRITFVSLVSLRGHRTYFLFRRDHSPFRREIRNLCEGRFSSPMSRRRPFSISSNTHEEWNFLVCAITKTEKKKKTSAFTELAVTMWYLVDYSTCFQRSILIIWRSMNFFGNVEFISCPRALDSFHRNYEIPQSQ